MNKKKGILLATVVCFWGITLVGAFMTGWSLKPEQLDVNSESSKGKEAASVLEEKESSPATFTFGKDDVASDAEIAEELEEELVEERPPSGAELSYQLSKALRDSNPINRMATITRLLQDLNPENLEEAIGVFENMSENMENNQAYRLFMYAWGSFDGAGAVEYSMNRDDGRRGVFYASNAITGWATSDPHAAAAWIANEASGDDRRSRFGKAMLDYGLVSGWLKTDPRGAQQYVASMDSSEGRERYIGLLANHYMENGVFNAVQWASSIPADESGFQEDVFKYVSAEYAREDPKAAAQWLERQPDKALSGTAISRVASEWAREDPKAAVDWLVGMDYDENQQKGMATAFDRWARDDPNSAGEWLNEQGSKPELDAAVSAFAERISREDPEAAVDWALQITDVEDRVKSITVAGQNWFRQDPEAATTWVNSTDLPQEVQESIVNPPRRRDYRDYRGFSDRRPSRMFDRGR